MRSRQLKAQLRLSILLSTPLAVAGCAGTLPTPVTLSALDCSALIPSSHRAPVAPTPLPPATATAGQIWTALDGQTASLDRANGHIQDLVEIADNCQAQQVKLLAALKPKHPRWMFWAKN